ncbi:TSUP family transporter [Bradyrhizobium sp. BR 1432]|uniref:TSUP family transporter n=1 Tax=Bradyrhizobium sp. BR 1432 TaxID=3447966 RepID=UPI003EE62579
MLTIFFAIISLLYATVGQAGGTAFLALMAFSSFPSTQMRPTALLLNIVAATYSTWVFNRGGYVDWKKLTPLVIASVPTALIGGLTVLPQQIYDVITGAVLLIAAAVLLLGRAKEDFQTPSRRHGARLQ